MAIREQYLEIPGINQFKDMRLKRTRARFDGSRETGGWLLGGTLPLQLNWASNTEDISKFYVWQSESVLSGMDVLRGEKFLFPR